MEKSNPIIEIYTEYTPNPDSLKFVTSRMLLPNTSVDFRTAEEVENSPAAEILFKMSFVKGVFITNNFVTITKGADNKWEEIIPEVKIFLKEYIGAGNAFVTQVAQSETTQAASDIDKRIDELLNTYVKPAVEQDGGAIQFKSFDKGVVTVLLQGSCSGCPSATLTLKSGIEGLLKRMIPEVTEVVAEEI